MQAVGGGDARQLYRLDVRPVLPVGQRRWPTAVDVVPGTRPARTAAARRLCPALRQRRQSGRRATLVNTHHGERSVGAAGQRAGHRRLCRDVDFVRPGWQRIGRLIRSATTATAMRSAAKRGQQPPRPAIRTIRRCGRAGAGGYVVVRSVVGRTGAWAGYCAQHFARPADRDRAAPDGPQGHDRHRR